MLLVAVQLPLDAVTVKVNAPGTGEKTDAGTVMELKFPGGTNNGGPLQTYE